MANKTTYVFGADDKELKEAINGLKENFNSLDNEVIKIEKSLKNYLNKSDELKRVNDTIKEQKVQAAQLKKQIDDLRISDSKNKDIIKEKTLEYKKQISAIKLLEATNRAEVQANKKNITATKDKIKLLKSEQKESIAAAKTIQKESKAVDQNTTAKKTNSKATGKLTNNVVRHLRQIETLVIAYYALSKGFQATIGTGIQVNRMMEDNTSGIAALLSANTQMTLSNGQAVNSYEKFTIGLGVAKDTMEDLRKASVKTYATFPQLTEIFQQAIGQTLSMGDSFGTTTQEIIDNTVKLSQRMSNIAGAIGMPMDRVREEIRSLLSGNASTDSLISTMIFGSPGEANKAVRMAKARGENALKGMFDEKLLPFDALETVQSYTRTLLQLQDAWSNAMRKLVDESGLYGDLTTLFGEMADEINNGTGSMVENFKAFYEGTKLLGAAVMVVLDPVLHFVGAVWRQLGALSVKMQEMSPNWQGMKRPEEEVKKIHPQQKILNNMLEQEANFRKLISVYKKSGLDTKRIESQLKAVQANLALQAKEVRLEEIKVKQTKEIIEKAKEEALLQTKIAINSKLIDDAEKENNRTLEKKTALLDKIKKNNEQILQLKKRINASPSDEVKYQQQIDTLNKNNILQQQQISELDAKKARTMAQERSIRLENNALMNNQVSAEQLTIDMGRLKVESLSEQYSILTDSEEKEKKLNELLKAQIAYEKALLTGDYKKEKQAEKLRKKLAKIAKEQSTLWDEVSKGMMQSMETNFFDLFMGKFDSLKDYFKNFFKDMFNSGANSMASGLSKILSSGIGNMLGLTGASVSGLAASEGLTLVGENYVGGGTTDGQANIILSQTGEIIKGADRLQGGTLETLSNIKSAYSLFTSGGMAATIGSGIGSLASGLGSLGFTSAAGSTAAFGAGVANPALASMAVPGAQGTAAFTAGASASPFLTTTGGAVLGGIGGYALGSLGDSLFGAETKAANYGAIGGAAGAVIGSIVPVIGTAIGAIIGAALGSIIGGAFGSTKVRGQGLYSKGVLSQDTVSGIQTYVDYRKKSWFSSKTWTVYKDADSKIKEALDATFETLNTMADVLLNSSMSNVTAKGGKYTVSNLMESALPMALIREVMGIGREEILSLWKDYAKDINSTVIEAMQQATADFRSTIRSMELYSTEDQLEKLAKQASFATADYELLAKTIGVDISKITVATFNTEYRKAIAKDFSHETIAQWNQLATALTTATDAQKAYQNALEQQQASYAEYIINASSGLNNMLANSFKNFSDSLSELFNTFVSLEERTNSTIRSIKSGNSGTFQNLVDYNRLMREFEEASKTTDAKAIESTYSEILALSKTLGGDVYQGEVLSYLESNKPIFQEKQDIMRVSIVEGLGELLGLNEEQLSQLSLSVKDGVVTNQELSNISSLTTSQKDAVNQIIATNLSGFNTLTEAERETKKSEIISGLENLEIFSKSQLDALHSALEDGVVTNQELSNITGLTQLQKEGIIQVANNSDYFSTEGTLSNLEEYARLQLDAYRQDIAKESVGISKGTFEYGDYVGAQEQIDIAKRLGMSYEAAAPLVSSLQTLDVSKDLKGDLKSLLGFTGTTYDAKKASQITALSPYLSSGINEGVESIKKEADYNVKLDAALSKFEKEKLQSDEVRELYRTAGIAWKHSSYYEREEDLSRGIPFKKGGYSTYSGAQHTYNNEIAAKYNAEFKETLAAYRAYETLLNSPGFAVGSPFIERDQIAQIHKGEAIIPKTFNDGIRSGELTLSGGKGKKDSEISNQIKRTNDLLYKLSQIMINLRNNSNRDLGLQGAIITELQEIKTELEVG